MALAININDQLNKQKIESNLTIALDMVQKHEPIEKEPAVR